MSERITYDNKVPLNNREEINDINKHTADDDNEIKSVVNSHADDIEANQTAIGSISGGTGDAFETRALAMVSPGADNVPFVVYGEAGFNGQYRYLASDPNGYVNIYLYLTSTDTVTKDSTEVVESGGVFQSENAIRNEENEFNNVFSDNSFETGLFSKVSGSGDFEYITYNGVRTLHVTDCIVQADIDFSTDVDLSKNWSFTMFVNSLALSTTNIRIIAQVLKSNGSQTGDRFELFQDSDLSNKIILSDNYSLESDAVEFRIYLDCTGDELYVSNFFIGNAPYSKFVPYDKSAKDISDNTVSISANTQNILSNSDDILKHSFRNVVPNNIFNNGFDGWTDMPNGVNSADLVITLENESSPFNSVVRRLTAGNATGSNNFGGIAVRVGNDFKEGDVVVFRGLIKKSLGTLSPYIQLRAKDESLVTLETIQSSDYNENTTDFIESGDIEMTIPANTEWVFAFLRDWAIGEHIDISGWTITKKETSLSGAYIINDDSVTGIDYSIVEVDSVNGDDNNSGLVGSPVATFSKAVDIVKDYSFPKIIVRDGDYRETLDYSSFGYNCKKITVITPTGEVSRFLGSKKIDVFAKTGGYTNIYESTITDTIPNHGIHLDKRILFEDGNGSKPIIESERSPLQKGLSNRLPYTELIEVDFDTDLATTLTNLDNEPNGGIYYDTANNKMYIVTSNQSDPSVNGFSYEYTARSCTTNPTRTDYLDLEMDNVQFYFSNSNGCNNSNFNKVERFNCRVFGAVSDGFKDSTNILLSYSEESAGCGNDGQNGHYDNLANWDSTDLRTGTNKAIYYNSWSHDNYDDGVSHHERGEFTTYGGLYEYNWDRGIAPSNTCNATSNNPHIRNNGQGVGIDTGATGIGYSVVNGAIGVDQKTGCTALVNGGIIENNTIGGGVQTLANLLTLRGVVFRENTDFNISASFGIINSDNCKSTQSSGNHKTTSNGGVINVNNDSDLN